MKTQKRLILTFLFVSSASLGWSQKELQFQPQLAPQEKQKLFEQIFGKKTAGGQSEIPAILDKKESGFLWVNVDPQSTSIQIKSQQLLNLLYPHLKEEAYNKLEENFQNQTTITTTELSPYGVDIQYDAVKVLLVITIEGAIRKARDLEIAPPKKPREYEHALKPDKLSAYSNIYISQRFQHLKGSPFQQTERDALGITFLPKVNVYQWVLEGDLTFLEKRDPLWARGALRAVYDLPDSMIRCNVGDLNYLTTGLQSFIPIGGVGISKDFGLQPYTITTPITEQEFYLEEPAQVEVYSNGQFVQSFSLTPGPYNLYNLPLLQGFNNVVLRILGESGQVQEISLSMVQDIRLLQKGLHEYTYNIGLPSEEINSRWHYKKSQPTLSAFHKYGLTSQTTIGGFIQGNKDKALIGAEADFALPLGLFSLQIAGSRFDHKHSAALHGQYLYQNSNASINPWQRNFSFILDYFGQSFALPSASRLSITPSKFNITSRYSQLLSKNLTGIFTISRNGFYSTSGKTHRYSAMFRYRPYANFEATLELTSSQNVSGLKDRGGILRLSYTLPGSYGRLSGTADQRSHTYTAAWTYNNEQLSTSVNAQTQGDRSNLFGSINYRTERARLQASHSLFSFRNPTSLRSQTTLNMATALAYTDGYFAVSSPIQDSFALLIPSEELQNSPLGIIGGQSAQLIKGINWLGPKVITPLSPYEYTPLTIQSTKLPIGSSISPSRVILFPQYGSGFGIHIDLVSTASIRGFLVDSTGAPLKLVRGIIYKMGKEGWVEQPQVFFKNKRGKFFLMGIQPGSYQVQITNRSIAPIQFHLKADQKGIVQLGDLVAEEQYAN